MPHPASAEGQRLAESEARTKHWKRWGPYLAERAWGTVREDYSPDGDVWRYFPHDHARSRVYRWTEDGILGICDNHQYLCFALAFWNYKDPILKERLFGLNGNEGNHGEDCKEVYYYLDSTPTHSYLKGLYKYPQEEFPYRALVEENGRRTRAETEFEIQDTGVFTDSRYFDITAEYAKRDVDDILIRITIANRGPEPSQLVLLPTLWFRNTWSWGPTEDPDARPILRATDQSTVEAQHPTLGNFVWSVEPGAEWLFTENETNSERIFGIPSLSPYVKDAFHSFIVNGKHDAINPKLEGTKAAAAYRLQLNGGEQRTFRFRLFRSGLPGPSPEEFESLFALRISEADQFYSHFSKSLPQPAREVQRQAFAGLFWSKQFYHYVVETWLNGDAAEPPPPPERKSGRNHRWRHIFNEDVISMPDKWEYPWYAAWDLAFHCVAVAPADPDYAKSLLNLFLREWYLHPNGQIPAYEWFFGDVNPPVHAWAAHRVYQIDNRLTGRFDRAFLERVFHKLLMNFTWWVNRKDAEGANVFEGGFLGLDNIGVFNRSEDLPPGWLLEQSDGSSWMGMYSLNMLKIALELSKVDNAYEDIASKFFEHFLHIADAINHHDGDGLWDEQDGFYYDRLRMPDRGYERLRARSLVGIVPLFASSTLDPRVIDRHSGFKKRMQWFIDHRPDLTSGIASLTQGGEGQRRLLSVVNRERTARILRRVFDEDEFLSPYGVRSLSRFHKEHPYMLEIDGHRFQIDYEPGESESGMFGGNSNWRGPVWFPMNFLLIETLQRLDHYYGDSFKIEFPTSSGNYLRFGDVAACLSRRLSSLFLPDANGRRPVYGDVDLFQKDPNFNGQPLFYEFFHGDTGKGLGASHQTGWTGLVAKLLQQSGV